MAWPTVSGANQTISADSRVATGTSLTGTLLVNSGVTLCTEGTAAINVSTITNNGTINHTGSGTFTSTTVVNSGAITITSASPFSWTSGGAFTNNAGASITTADGNITLSYTSNTFSNYGSILSATGNITLTATTGVTNNYSTGTITTSAGNIDVNKMTNSGSIISAGTFTKSTTTYPLTNQATGTITATGNINIEGTTDNYGIISSGGTYTKASTTGSFTNQSTGTVTVTGNIAIEGITSNYGTITSTGGTYTKTGTSENFTNQIYSNLTTAGNIRIEGGLTNIGSITSTGGSFTKISSAISSEPFLNQQGGQLKIRGDISIQGHIDNCGLIEITNSGNFLKTTVTNPLTTGASNLINNAGSTIHIRGNAQIEGAIINSGNIKVEGQLLANLSTGSSSRALTNNSGSYIRVCGELYYTANISNSGTMEVLGQVFMSTASNGTLTNNAAAVLNVTEDIDIISGLTNSGCITIGDSLWKRNSSANIIINGGTIYCANFVQDDGVLQGGASSAARGYLAISGISTTLNTVSLSNYLDLCDASGAGAGAQYFDTESPAYAYPTANITDCGSAAPCTQAALIACADALPAVSGSCSVLLPIELLFFKAYCIPSNTYDGEVIIKMSWITTSEINNDYFTIERSLDGVNFELIAKINGAGNSSIIRNYEFTDKRSYSVGEGLGIRYYRLRQTDFDGKSETFSLVSVKDCREKENNSCIRIYPNPIDENEIYFSVWGMKNNEMKIEIYNIFGELVYDETILAGDNRYDAVINRNQRLSSGMYVIIGKTETEICMTKLIIK
ncbi:MAG: hypothetical protein HYU69_14070 [Bacteroidetes bacterium]|nr:hypothetical protein [Bacteroidota bacterium]